jgi:NTE family protein
MALRGIMEGAALLGGLEGILKNAGIKNVKKLVVFSVNAETSPDVTEYRSDQIPVMSRVFGSLVDIPINRYSADTLLLMRLGVEKWKERLRNRPADAESVFAQDADIYFIDVSFGAVADANEQQELMKIPTTLYLTDQQIDRLLLSAARLIRNDPEFQRLIRDLE